jgi:hypothetical protein
MSDPFSSDYVPSQATQAVPVAARAQKPAVTAATGERPLGSAEGADPKAYGFEPQRYGLGKPRRVVIRGKIAIE